ncbi:recombinase family protein [Collimonas pratensis]|uniref:recombinase family protein n=1 Tax=Collimonas pratensis TaxID=279113 RepID=UPI00143CC8D0|nr:recombinase family protein [Collimonas pratensis]NKI72357.1 recombinase family protein [Collimonas pratensis]
MTKPKTCRIYQRVSTSGQDLTRQAKLVSDAEAAGFYVAGVYSEKISGTVASRPELNRLISDLKTGDVVIAESLDRISRLQVADGEALISRITEKGAKIAVPDLIDLSDIIANSTDPLVQIVLEANQKMMLKIALHMARKDYEQRAGKQASGIEVAKAKGLYKGRKADTVANTKIVELRKLGYTIAKVASTLNVSVSQVKLILKKQAAAQA